MHRTDLFIVSGADLEYTGKKLLKFHGEWLFGVLMILKWQNINKK